MDIDVDISTEENADALAPNDAENVPPAEKNADADQLTEDSDDLFLRCEGVAAKPGQGRAKFERVRGCGVKGE